MASLITITKGCDKLLNTFIDKMTENHKISRNDLLTLWNQVVSSEKVEKSEEEFVFEFEPKLSFRDFKSISLLREAIYLYFRDRGEKLTNLGKSNAERLKEIIERFKINLNDLGKFYILAIQNAYTNIPVKYLKYIEDVQRKIKD